MENQAFKWIRKRSRFILILLAACVPVLFLGACGGGSGNAITITIAQNTTQNLDAGQVVNFTATLANDAQNQGVNWTFTGTGCSGTGLSAGQCGTLTNKTNFAVTYTAPAVSSTTTTVTVTLTAASVASPGVTTPITITVEPPIAYTTLSLPNGSNGVQYSQPIVITGGVSPFTFTVHSGSLPAGLNLNSQTGTVSGFPTSTTTTSFTFTVQVADSGGATAVVSPSYTIVISPPPALSILTTTLPAATQNVSYNASVVTTPGQGGVTPLTWSILSGTLPAGLQLNSATGQISGIPTAAGTNPLVFKVKDSALPASQTATSQNITLVFNVPPPLQINTFSVPFGTTGVPYSTSLQAIGGVPPYVWSVSTGLLPAGLTLNANGQISGTPLNVINSDAFTVQVQDSESTPQKVTQAYTLSVTAGTTAQDLTLLNGTYSFLFRGFDSDGFVAIAGAFTADGLGNITSLTEDSNRVSGVFSGSSLATTPTSTYTMGTDGRGTITWTVSNVNTQTRTENYLLSLKSDGSIEFIENSPLDPAAQKKTWGSGIIKKQTTSLTSINFSGNYAFGFSGQDSSKKQAALVGVVHADGVSTLTSPGGTANMDSNDAGTYSPSLSVSGQFSAGTSLGRGIASFTYQLPSQSQFTRNYTFFFVSPSDLFFIEIDPTGTTNPPRLAGEMILQQPSTQLNASTLNGASVVSGTGSVTNSTAFAGLLSADGNGNVTSFSYDENNGGTITSPSTNTFSSGKYTVSSIGRVGFTSTGSRVAAAYLIGQNQGFLIGSDSAATSGLLEQQTGGPFSAASFQGGYAVGEAPPADSQTNTYTGQVNSPGIGTAVTGTIDSVPPSGSAQIGQSLAGASYTLASSGRATMTTNGAGGLFPVSLVFYVVSPGDIRLIPIDVSNTHPGVIFFDH